MTIFASRQLLLRCSIYGRPTLMQKWHTLHPCKKEWVGNVNHFGRRFYHVVGAVEMIRQYSDKIGQWWMQGMGCSRNSSFGVQIYTWRQQPQSVYTMKDAVNTSV